MALIKKTDPTGGITVVSGVTYVTMAIIGVIAMVVGVVIGFVLDPEDEAQSGDAPKS